MPDGELAKRLKEDIIPHISTLVEDIYKLFDGEFTISPSHTVRREDAVKSLRMSILGYPDRQLWYELNSDIEGETLPPYTMMKFLYGHLLEDMIIDLAIQAGHTVTDRQKEVEVDGVPGHIDCIIDDVLIDVKSASSFAFEKFRDHTLKDNDTFGYIPQLSSYFHCVGGTAAGFLAIDKTLGHICLDLYTPEELRQYDTRGRIRDVKRMLGSNEEPEHCFTPVPEGVSKSSPDGNGNYVLSTRCSYCRYKHRCWRDSNNGEGLRTFLYSKGPRFFTHVEKEPRVMEITSHDT